MDRQELKVAIGERVLISRPSAAGRFAANVERFSTVTAVRPKSFDAGGLCFRYDGREWNGRHRVQLLPQSERNAIASLVEAHEAIRFEHAQQSREDVALAYLLSCRHQRQWLKLGVEELRRIAALHGITAEPGTTSEIPAVNAVG